MIRDRLVKFGMPKRAAREARLWLLKHEIAEWPGILQDIAAIEAVSRGGARHWAGQSCGMP